MLVRSSYIFLVFWTTAFATSHPHHLGLKQDHLPLPSNHHYWSNVHKSLHDENSERINTERPNTFHFNVAKFDDPPSGQWHSQGKSLVASGKVAVVLLAGGLGTRIGLNSPKGMLDIELPSHRSLFQMHAEMLLAQQNAAGAQSIPLYIMTSPLYSATIESAFEIHNYFGLNRRQVFFFNQTMLPCFHFDGSLALETPTKVALSPGGHGDLFHAMGVSGALKNMKMQGVQYVASFNVDNPLAVVPDPRFLGYCASLGETAPLCFKVVDHMRANEPLNTILLNMKTGTAQYYSYHDAPATDTLDKSGNIRKHGDIMHLIATVEFVERINANPSIPLLHKVPARIKLGDTVPKVSNGYKFERFLSEVFHGVGVVGSGKLTKSGGKQEQVGLFFVDRRAEFLPIKNGWDATHDSPKAARDAVLQYHDGLLRQHVSSTALLSSSNAFRSVELCPSLVISPDHIASALMHYKTDAVFSSASGPSNMILCDVRTDVVRGVSKFFSKSSPLDIIVKKRDNLQSLSRSEIYSFIEGFTKGTVPDYQMSALLMAIQLNGCTAGETNDLTMAMMASGDVADFSMLDNALKVDKHSTGGVGDGVSLLLAPLVAASGLIVPMMSGRGLAHTGGTLDKMESVTGVSTTMSFDQLFRVLKKTGVAIVGPTHSIAPADKKMYALRDVTGTVPSIPLIVASIMSKKLSGGADALVLDVKYGKGAFMVNRKDAIHLAKAMVSAGNAAGKNTVALLTTMSQPLGKHVGNWLEMYQTFQLLKRGSSACSGSCDDLLNVTYALAAQMLVMGNVVKSIGEGLVVAQKNLENGAALGKFLEMIDGQGGDTSVFSKDEHHHTCKRSIDVVWDGQGKEESGCLVDLNALEIGLISNKLGAGREKVEDTIDYCAGIILNKKVGASVMAGDVLATLFSNHGHDVLETAKVRTLRAFVVETAGEKGGDNGECLQPDSVIDSYIDRFGNVMPWLTYMNSHTGDKKDKNMEL